MFKQLYGLACFLYCLLMFNIISFNIETILYRNYILFKVYIPDVFFKLIEKFLSDHQVVFQIFQFCYMSSVIRFISTQWE